MKYTLRTNAIIDENNNEHIEYGIAVIDRLGNVLKTVDNVFLCKEKAQNFINLCNREKLELIHLQNVIEDIL